MQRNDEANRIVATVPWSTQKRGFSDEIYYDAVVHDAQLCIAGAALSEPAGATPPAALETMSKAISGNQANSLSAAYTPLALDASRKAPRPRPRLASARSARTAVNAR